MPKIHRHAVTLASSLPLLLLLNAATTSVPGNRTGAYVAGIPLSPGTTSSPSADSIINLRQWRSESGGNGHWYGILAVPHDWIEADSVARTLMLDSMSGYLATIQGGSENYFVFDSILLGLDRPGNNDQFLLGGHRINAVWRWTTGEPFCYANWASGEPNHSWEHAISIWGPNQSPQPTPPGSWNNTEKDVGASSSLRFWAVVEWGDLNLTPVSTCGNGIAECGEECDDGNLIDFDGCNATCDNEVCGDGIVQPWEECDDGNLIAGDGCDPVCSLQVCGNGVLEPGEECDDGNLLSDDSCNSICDLEVCGDGVRQHWEECDDGNLIAGDGCDPTCHLQVCGNGELEPGEECDDGNLLANDSCNAVCDVERCGDGVVQPWEECDDGNLIAGDGCDPICRVESCGNGRVDAGECCDDSNAVGGDGCGPTCLDESVVCGNGVVECPEECDDGNALDGDGCQSNCTHYCIPGDMNLSHTATATDLIILINYVFIRAGPPQPCWSAGDMNCNSRVTSADIITLINYLFKSGSLAVCDRCAPCD